MIAAVGLVASSGLQSVAGSQKTYKWTADPVTDEAYFSVNLARNGKLPVHINEVKADAQLVDSLKTKKDLFYSDFTGQGEADYRQLLQTSLEKGLKVFEKKEYPKTAEEWQQTWENADFANLAYLLNSNSTTVGCIIGKCTGEETGTPGAAGPAGRDADTTVEMAVLICNLHPAATKDKAPFDEEYFTGLIARTAKLTGMTADDLKAPTNDGTAAAAIPTIMLAGLLATLAAVAA
ncbi:SAG family member [Eimeria brunetti]|uniref:SAG family member n=1 Tax=Eimeria brunetti TaxID=51314 RepID=U6LCX5_9EIME|nr:SAG family member [Eimeria brunetti]